MAAYTTTTQILRQKRDENDDDFNTRVTNAIGKIDYPLPPTVSIAEYQYGLLIAMISFPVAK